MRMHNPPHPGEIIKQLRSEPLGDSVMCYRGGTGIGRESEDSVGDSEWSGGHQS